MSELTYRQDSPYSYFQDLTLARVGRSDGAAETRLFHHGNEMRNALKDQDAQAARSLRSAGFETRVTPQPTAGEGQSFTPPLWLIEEFATARRAGRVLADLIPRFPCPPGVHSVQVPVLTTGSSVTPQQPTTGVSDTDIVDQSTGATTPGSSLVTTFAGQNVVALQLLEQSPQGAHFDWAMFMDLTSAYDAQLEAQLLNGSGSAAGAGSGQLLGVMNVTGINAVTYTTAGTPSAQEMFPVLGSAAAQVGDNRELPPECWLVRTARWAFIFTSEETSTIPLGLPTPYYLGNTDDTPNPCGGLIGWPVFADDAIPANLGGGGNQDVAICLRPSDLILFEGNPQISVGNVYIEPYSQTLSVAIGMHDYAAAITNRYPSGISVISGSGMVVQSGY